MEKYRDTINMNQMKILIDNLQSSLCEIIKDNGHATGFLCKFKFKNKRLLFLITNYHAVSDFKNNIKIKLDNKIIEINLKLSRKIFYDKDIGYTCIEILNEDKISNENIN